MTNEIKEILDLFYNEYPKEEKQLEDYITNLQEENERLYKELEKADSITQSCIFEGSRSAGKSYRQCLNWLEDYKSRIDKAIEYIEEYQEVLKEHNGDWLNYQDGFKPYLLDILQGDE